MSNKEYVFYRISRLQRLRDIRAPKEIIENEKGLIENAMIRVCLFEEATDDLIRLVCEVTEN